MLIIGFESCQFKIRSRKLGKYNIGPIRQKFTIVNLFLLALPEG